MHNIHITMCMMSYDSQRATSYLAVVTLHQHKAASSSSLPREGSPTWHARWRHHRPGRHSSREAWRGHCKPWRPHLRGSQLWWPLRWRWQLWPGCLHRGWRQALGRCSCLSWGRSGAHDRGWKRGGLRGGGPQPGWGWQVWVWLFSFSKLTLQHRASAYTSLLSQ